MNSGYKRALKTAALITFLLLTLQNATTQNLFINTEKKADAENALRSSGEVTLAPIAVPSNGVINLTDAISFNESMRGKTVNVPLDVTSVAINPAIGERDLYISECADELARWAITIAYGIYQNSTTWNNPRWG